MWVGLLENGPKTHLLDFIGNTTNENETRKIAMPPKHEFLTTALFYQWTSCHLLLSIVVGFCLCFFVVSLLVCLLVCFLSLLFASLSLSLAFPVCCRIQTFVAHCVRAEKWTIC